MSGGFVTTTFYNGEIMKKFVKETSKIVGWFVLAFAILSAISAYQVYYVLG
jgi:hypothetical protein